MNRAIAEAQIQYVITQTKFTNLVNVIVIGLLGLILFQQDAAISTLLWVGYGYLVFLLREWVARLCARMLKVGRGLGSIKALITLSLFLSGSVWAVAAILFLEDLVSVEFVLISVTIATMASGVLPAAAALTTAYLAFLLPSVGTVILSYLHHDITTFALFGIVYLISMVVMSLRLKEIITRSITADLENAELLVEVEEAKQKAEAANHSKSEFLAGASHDLRQPLHAIDLLLTLLRERLETGSNDLDALRILQRIQEALDGLLNLFNQLLDMSRLDSGLFNAHIGPISLAEAIAPVVEEFRAVAQAKGIELVTDIRDEVVESCPVLLNRVMRNLISNAIKFTDRGEVTIASRVEQQQLVLTVTDSGCGMDDSVLPHIFKEHYRSPDHNQRQIEGAGLGLAVVEKMLKLLGHSIAVQSVPGKGTCFELRLSVSDERAPAPTEVFPLTDFVLSSDGLTVLVADDNVQALTAMTQLLQQWGCQTVSAQSLLDVMQLPSSTLETINLVVCDHHLQDSMTSEDVISFMRSKGYGEIPLITITADTSIELVHEMRSKKRFLIHKPVKPAHLRRAVNQLLNAD